MKKKSVLSCPPSLSPPTHPHAGKPFPCQKQREGKQKQKVCGLKHWIQSQTVASD